MAILSARSVYQLWLGDALQPHVIADSGLDFMLSRARGTDHSALFVLICLLNFLLYSSATTTSSLSL